MTRRTFVAGAATALAAAEKSGGMGVATTCYMTVWRPKDTLEFLDHCRKLGAAGIQASLSSTEPAYIQKLRSQSEGAGMYLEVMCALPKEDPADFERIVKAAKDAGSLCVRAACLGGRRYETFSSLEEWKQFVANSRAAVKRALPILEKHRYPMALENHKDWTVEEFSGLLKEFSSPYLGVCLDTGNNISLLDDPYEVVERLAPYAISTHIKDMGVEEFRDGFRLSEVPLGEGILDLPRMVRLVRRHKPATRMTLEMITRNPLEVPCLTEKYWATFPERNGRYLARTLAMVKAHPPRQPLPTMDGKDRAQQLQYENDNVKRCLAWASQHLTA